MVLTRRAGALVTPAVLLAFVAGCSQKELEYSESALLLPGTLFDGLTLADAVARDWSENAHLVRLGGEFAVMNERGEARNHSYVYDARFGPATTRRLTVHLVAGMPWSQDTPVATIDPPFVDFPSLLDSDAVVGAALDWARAINADHPDSIPIPEIFAASLASVATWPERRSGSPPESVAWRVDFVEEDIYSPPSGPDVLVYWSLARFYFQPATGDTLGHVVPPGGREIYPTHP